MKRLSKFGFKQFNTFAILYAIFFFNVFQCLAQVPNQVNAGNPNFPFPQFKDYVGGKCLASNNPDGVPHAEMEQRIIDAYKILTNNMTYNINLGGSYGPLVVAGVKYIQIQDGGGGNSDISHCGCVEGDGYYLLAAAYMADKPTFDGYYMWAHDRQFQKTKRYSDCVTNSPAYAYSPGISGAGSAGTPTNVNGGGLAGNSAWDGDVDLSLALLVAWRQWGDSASICVDPCTGKKVYYRDEAIKYIRTMVDTLKYTPSLPVKRYLSGGIGLDGYHKGGDSWNETTNWASGGYLGMIPNSAGPQTNYVDYAASAYFRTYADVFQSIGTCTWCVNQYRRAEASDDWLIGQAYAQGLGSYIGQYGVTGITPTFSTFAQSEDFRFGWRTIMNYMWNGAPNRTWNPTTHQDVAGSNTYNYDMAIRMATFVKNLSLAPMTYTTINYCGAPTLRWDVSMNLGAVSGFPLNWGHGTMSPSAVVSQDFDLQAQMFRHCIIEWDQYNDPAQKYLTSRPRYFHEWFRMLGMMVLTGNMHDPLDMVAGANIKVYKAVDKTFAYPGDNITYTLSYRNYGKNAATGIVLKDYLDNGVTIVSSNKAYSVSGNVVTWNIPNLSGFSTGGLNLTRDSLTYTVLVGPTAPVLLKQNATITSSNGGSWVSNEFPNRQTATMERNWVDILNQSPISVSIVPSKTLVNPGDTLTYTVTIKNQTVPFLNGGRPGVNIGFATSGLSASASAPNFKYRIYHGADEAYINYANYRVSYFLNKPGPPVWSAAYNVCEGVPGLTCTTNPTFTTQNLVPGTGYNHRFILTFPPQLATITPFLFFYGGQGRYVHEGALYPQRLVMQVNSSFTPFDWTTDWSYDPTINGAADGHPYYPVTNDWTDPLNLNVPVTKYHKNSCTNDAPTVASKVLVEEWDGFTWRRIYGTSPVSGTALTNVTTTSQFPTEVTYGGTVPGFAGPSGVSGNTLTWPVIPSMLTNESYTFKYWVTVKNNAYFGCGTTPNPTFFVATASGSALNQSKVNATTTVGVTCMPIVVVPPVTTMTKTANATGHTIGAPITYTINYQQTHGQIVSGNLNAADWNNVVGGNAVNIAGNALNLNTGWSNQAWVHRYSHGTNGTIQGTLNFNANSPYQIIARQNGANRLEVSFNVNPGAGNFALVISTVVGGTTTTLCTAAPSPSFVGISTATSFDFRITINNSTVSVWVVKAGTAISGSATYVCTNVPVNAGYAGVRSAIGNAASLTNWYTNLDSGFNLILLDPVPSGVTYGSATNANLASCPSCTGSPITGSLTSGIVTYKSIPGPVLYGESITYTWTGTVTSCPSGSQIVNTATLSLLGINPAPAAQVTTTCTSLPQGLDFTFIQATRKDVTVNVEWARFSEEGVSGYMLEKSIGDGGFKDVYGIMVDASHKGNYSYADRYENGTSQTIYYRIKIYMKDGRVLYSRVVNVLPIGTISVSAYPNPFEGTFNLLINSGNSENRFDAVIYDLSSKPVSELHNLVPGIPQVLGKELSSGVYVIKVIGGGQVITQKLEKLE